jgi:AcrR family transcriptional regulator
VPRHVKANSASDRNDARVIRTEAAIMDAAEELFVTQGYVPTTLAQVAERAGVATRTVFVRFDSKVTLFRRVIDRALAGNDDPIDVAHQPRTQDAMSAPTLSERIDALVDVCVGIMQRAAALFEVAAQAEGLEPALAEAWLAGRRATAELAASFWKRAAAAGLVPKGADHKLLAVTTDVFIAADTMVHLGRTRTWTQRDHRRWLSSNLRLLAALPPTR